MARPDYEHTLGRTSNSAGETHVPDRRYLLPRRRSGLLDYEDQDFRALRFLVDIDDVYAEAIAAKAIQDPLNIQLVDFVQQMGFPQEHVVAIRQAQDARVPEERRPYLQKYAEVVGKIPTIPIELSQARVNPFTEFEHHPPLLFGMGGGSKALNKALPIDVLSMVLTAEKLRRELNLGRCRIICANGITYTNIPKNPDFSKEGIDRVLSAERDILQIALERLGIADHWDVFLETDIENIIGPERKAAYDRMIADADEVPFIGGHYYSIEMAQMWSLLNQEVGGVKLGWFIRNLSKVQAEYIMDEQPFDARYVMFLALQGIRNTTSIPYVKAGVRIFPGTQGQVDKAAPYICYDPKDRVLLSPFEDPEAKLRAATEAGQGLRSRVIRGHFGSIIKLFEEIVFEKEMLPVPDPTLQEMPRKERRALLRRSGEFPLLHAQALIRRQRQIDDDLREDGERFSHPHPPRASRIGRRLEYMLDYLFEGQRGVVETLYKAAFPQAVK